MARVIADAGQCLYGAETMEPTDSADPGQSPEPGSETIERA